MIERITLGWNPRLSASIDACGRHVRRERQRRLFRHPRPDE